MIKKKSFGVALLLWFFTGGVGGHRIYIREKISILFYYWLLAVATIGILPLIDLFRLKRMIEQEREKEALKKVMYS